MAAATVLGLHSEVPPSTMGLNEIQSRLLAHRARSPLCSMIADAPSSPLGATPGQTKGSTGTPKLAPRSSATHQPTWTRCSTPPISLGRWPEASRPESRSGGVAYPLFATPLIGTPALISPWTRT